MPSLEEAKRVVEAKDSLRKSLNRPDWMRGIGPGWNDTETWIVVEVATEADLAKVPTEWEGVPVKGEVVGDFALFSCGGDSCPKGGEHVWDGPTITIKSYCYPCDGTGCDKCEGGEYVSGESGSCSKCGLSAMDHSMMNGP